MTERERDCVRAHTMVDKSTPATLKHACEALGIDEATLMLIRQEGKNMLATVSR